MKKVRPKIREVKRSFSSELIQSFDLLKNNNKPAEKETLISIAMGMKEAELATKRKLKTKPAKTFINNL